MSRGKIIQKMVRVTVTRGHSIQVGEHRNRENPIRHIGPGQTIEVPDTEVERLIATGFIVDPFAKKLPSGVEDIDMSVYTESSDSPAPDLKMPGRPLSNNEQARAG